MARDESLLTNPLHSCRSSNPSLGGFAGDLIQMLTTYFRCLHHFSTDPPVLGQRKLLPFCSAEGNYSIMLWTSSVPKYFHNSSPAFEDPVIFTHAGICSPFVWITSNCVGVNLSHFSFSLALFFIMILPHIYQILAEINILVFM